MNYFPSDQQYLITDGTAAPGAHGAPSNLRNYSPYWRSGGDINVSEVTEKRGPAGRVADEYLFVRRYMVEITDQVVEQENVATVGPTILFVPGNTRYTNERIYQRQFLSGHTKTVNALVVGVADTVEEAGVVKNNISLRATGPLTIVGF